MHVVEVDQSGKFGDTKVDTVLAFSNSIQFSVLVPSTIKRDCIKLLRKRVKTGKTLYTQLFAVSLFFLLKNYIERMEDITIDIEYPGQDAFIKDHLMNILQRAGYKVRRQQISFGLIGKHSEAHTLALATWRRQKIPNLVVTLEDIVGQFKA